MPFSAMFAVMSLPPKAGLYIVPTPIGNLDDLSARSHALLAAADVIACEDTRVTGKLLHLIGLKRPLVRHDDHASDAARAMLIARAANEIVVLCCDAGTPLISDPGYRLVRDARAAGVHISALPGPNAAITALSMSGLPSDRFLFVGFLPARAGPRKSALQEIAAIPATLVFYESAQRLGASLCAMAEILGERDGFVVREISKLHETGVSGSLSHLAQYFATPPKGEIVIIVAPPKAGASAPMDDDGLRDLLRAAMERTPPARAARDVARQSGAARDRLYAMALEIQGKT